MNTHYQRVLESDRQLPLPMSWLTRAMSSWWLIGALGVFVVGYVAAALVPVGGRYLWQARLIDLTQDQVLNAWPLTAGAWLLAAAVLWAALRRLAWRWDNLGRLVAVLGLSIVLVTQSWAFRSQSTGVAAVPVSSTPAGEPTNPLNLTYTTRFGDTQRRELIVMLGATQPIAVNVDALPRWNDAAGDELATIKVHDEPKLAAMLGYRVRITPAAYIAEGTLRLKSDGTQAATPKPTDQRNTTALPYPADALLAIEFEVEHEDGTIDKTTAWLPFEPEGTESLSPKRFYLIEGFGTVGLAFRPASRKLPFAMAATPTHGEEHLGSLFVADSDNQQLLQPESLSFDAFTSTQNYQAIDSDNNARMFELHWLNRGYQIGKPDQFAFIVLKESATNLFITAGLVTFLAGVALDLLLGFFGPKPKRNPATQPSDTSKPKVKQAQ